METFIFQHASVLEPERGELTPGQDVVVEGDYGLARAVEDDCFEGPRMFYGGKQLTQTGGAGDWRSPGRTVYDSNYFSPAIGVICDGIAEVRRAVREEVRRGAHHIKVYLSGAIDSPTDRVDSTQFSLEEHIALKLQDVLDHAFGALELAHRARIPIAFGTDLFADMHGRQLEEFTLRCQVQAPADVIRSATTIGAQVLRRPREVGTVAPGAYADLLVLEGNPLQDIRVLTTPDSSLKLIMKGGRVYKNQL